MIQRFTPFAAVALALALGGSAVRAQDTTQKGVRIGLTYQPGTKPGVVVLAVKGPWGDTLQAMLQRDLDYGDRIEVIGLPGTAASSTVQQLAGNINYVVWKQLGAAAAVQATLTAGGVHVALLDVGQSRVANVQTFPLPGTAGSADWRLAVHGIADELERWITGVRGISQTRVLYVRGGRVYVVDSDGWGDHPVSDAGMVLGPAWHPNGHVFAYAVNTGRGWDIAVRDIATGQTQRLGARGLNMSPEFSPDGASLIYAHGDENGTDLVLTSYPGFGNARQITVGRGTDNNQPTFSPDGRRIAFTSGRAGHPEVYIADADGSNPELLTPYNFGDQNYRSDPDWSPDGRQVAFQSQINGTFQVMTITLRDRSVKQLTSEGINEQPSWAPDGRHLVLTSSRTGVRQLFVLDTESGRARQLTHAAGARLGAWSRILDHTP